MKKFKLLTLVLLFTTFLPFNKVGAMIAPPPDPDPDPNPVDTNPVIIIPGIAGTELYDENDQIWMNIERMYGLNDYFLTDSLSLDTNGNSIKNVSVGNVIKEKIALNVFDVDIFEGLSTDLENNNYQENTNLFFFPYDWRLDLNNTKDLLNQKIEEVKTKTGKNKVDIIAHSMGGLLIKEYLNTYGKDSLDKLIFVGTPHLGAPKAGKILLEGDRFSIPWLEEDRIRDIAKNSPAVFEILPNQTYFNQIDGYFKKYSPFNNDNILNYTETKNFFLNDKKENSIMFQKAENFYNKNLENFDFGGIDTYNIAGCKTPTQATYGFGIFGEIAQTEYISGDGTVPLASTDYINIPSQNKFYIKDADHAELPSIGGVSSLITKILNNNINDIPPYISNNSSICNKLFGKIFTWRSPVEVHIYDSQGNHTGPIENNAIEYGIKGIDYDVMGHDKFMFLPTDENQEYLVEAKGLETGSFDLSISEIENGQYLTTQVFNDVPITKTSVVDLTVNNLENKSLELKNNGVTEEVLANATLNGELALDLTPPETAIKIDNVKDKKQNKNQQITLIATDSGSGILETTYSLDSGDTFNIYSKPFIVDKKINKILYYSIDKAGNNEETKEFDLEKNKTNKCKSWKCLEINKNHNYTHKIYKKIKSHEQEFIKKFKVLKLKHG